MENILKKLKSSKKIEHGKFLYFKGLLLQRRWKSQQTYNWRTLFCRDGTCAKVSGKKEWAFLKEKITDSLSSIGNLSEADSKTDHKGERQEVRS